MDLKEIRREIDATDDEILRLFLKRMMNAVILSRTIPKKCLRLTA